MRKAPPKKKEADGSPRNKAAHLATIPESSPLTVEGAGRASDEKRCKCNHVITQDAIDELVGIQEMIPVLTRIEAWTCYRCLHEHKKRIRTVRPENSDLLICVTCCDHLCSGPESIAYPFGHSRAHALEKQHWYAVLYTDPERGFCFKCDAEVPKAGGNEVGLQEIRNIVSQKLLAPQPSVGQTEAEVNPKKVEITGKVQAESYRSVFDLNLPSYESRSSDAQGYAIRGITNLGNTCYMSAVLQCLFVLGKLRERMLTLNLPNGLLIEVLMQLFVETSAEGDVLDPRKVLGCVALREAKFTNVLAMQDSHEFLTVLRGIWREGEKGFDRQSVVDSIFGFELLQTLSCKNCGPSLSSHFYLDLKLDFPSKWHPTKSVASPQASKRKIAFKLFGSEVIVEVGEFMIAPALIKMP